MRLTLVILWTLILISSGATAENRPTIAFHAVTTEVDRQAYRYDLDPAELSLAEEPWLTDEDIVTWDVSSGYIVLNGDKGQFIEKFDSLLNDKGFLASTFRLFVVVVNGEACFIGEFHSVVSSVMARYPSINDMDLHMGPGDALVMRTRTWDPKLVEALQDLGLYRGGLKVVLTAARMTRSEDLSRTTLEYDIELMNCDSQELMVLNPNLMGPDFEGYRAWFFAGLAGEDRHQVSEQMRRPGAFNEFDATWLVRVPAKETLRATLTRETGALASGTYNCFLIYPGPHDTAGSDPDFGDARLWYGQVKSNEVEVRVE